jgi:hypothetical protein
MEVRTYRLADSRTFWLAVCITLVTGAVGAQSGAREPPGTVRKQAFRPGVLYELQGVLREGIAVGVVLGVSDSADAPPPGTPTATSNLAFGQTSALEALKQRWATVYRIDHAGHVVTVTSPRAQLCTAGLSRLIPAQSFSGSLLEILFGVASTFDESLRQLPPPGIVRGGGTNGMSAEASDSITRPIILTFQGGNLQDALNRLVTTAPNLGWVAREACDELGTCRCYLSLLTETSVLQTSYDASAGLPVERR